MILVRITAPHFCAGIADGRAAPILAYMRGWTVRRIREYCAGKGWACEVWGSSYNNRRQKGENA